MKSLLRKTLIHAFSLFVTSQVLSGLVLQGGLQTVLLAGFILTLISFFIRPILQVITFPINLFTFGAFSLITNAILLYALTVFVREISIRSFVLESISFAGFMMPRMSLGGISAFIVVAFVLSCITSFLFWLIK